ncbi:hypothetical protein [Polynucleobacter sp. MWH-Jannik1A5]|uniref:hypothetical protein n=1 Tax=Polynucleobacter sp. MWH-Jannik1A5 TaxID=1855890 RepID=UPI001C0BDC9D|nr:hypothetical protein [Polynucleobacter sp. MWH-Jannik1A5]MBU3547467.1 hypothetical protein [Polynucleobacter sp. MWH-Jannik1A5]
MAGLFGPSNYDECILDGVKKANNKAAVHAVYDVCERKFPSPEDKKTERERKALIKKCRISEKVDSTISYIGLQNTPEVWSAIENIKNIKLVADGYTPVVKFQNNNQSGISGLMLGMGVKGKSCPTNYAEYDATFYCGGSWEGAGVSPNSYGSVPCPEEVKNFSRKSFCIIGLRPLVSDGSGMAKALNELGMCK